MLQYQQLVNHRPIEDISANTGVSSLLIAFAFVVARNIDLNPESSLFTKLRGNGCYWRWLCRWWFWGGWCQRCWRRPGAQCSSQLHSVRQEISSIRNFISHGTGNRVVHRVIAYNLQPITLNWLIKDWCNLGSRCCFEDLLLQSHLLSELLSKCPLMASAVSPALLLILQPLSIFTLQYYNTLILYNSLILYNTTIL